MMTLSPRLGAAEISTPWPVRYPMLVKMSIRPTLKIFLFPLTLPCFSGMGRSVGRIFFFNFLKFDTH